MPFFLINYIYLQKVYFYVIDVLYIRTIYEHKRKSGNYKHKVETLFPVLLTFQNKSSV